MGMAIVEFEGRFDKQGNLRVYDLPEGDGGGAYEIAGINERHHPNMAAQLKVLINAGKQQEAKTEAAAYIEQYTRGVIGFFPTPELAETNPPLEFVLRDIAFNRGSKGAAAVLQIALGMTDIDGIVGPATKREFSHQLLDPGPAELLKTLTAARETYERTSYGWKSGKRDESSKFWKGLAKRWAKAHLVALDRFA